jgi:hypothetical protein
MRTSLNRRTAPAADSTRQPARTMGVVPAQGTRLADVTAYRAAVGDLLAEVDGPVAAGRLRALQTLLAERLIGGEFDAVLSAVPGGIAAAIDGMTREISCYRAGANSSAAGMSAVIRIYLLAQIDAMWWGSAPDFQSDEDLLSADDLVDLEVLRRGGQLGFRYRRQAQTKAARVVRAAERRAWPDRVPRTAGLRFSRARPEAVALLNQVAAIFAASCPPKTPPLWVTSLARSVAHQHRLRDLGYAAVLPSAHCSGYATDIEILWYRRYDADLVLRSLLLDRQAAGEVSVIDEGQAWHVCISPAAVPELRRAFEAELGG